LVKGAEYEEVVRRRRLEATVAEWKSRAMASTVRGEGEIQQLRGRRYWALPAA